MAVESANIIKYFSFSSQARAEAAAACVIALQHRWGRMKDQCSIIGRHGSCGNSAHILPKFLSMTNSNLISSTS